MGFFLVQTVVVSVVRNYLKLSLAPHTCMCCCRYETKLFPLKIYHLNIPGCIKYSDIKGSCYIDKTGAPLCLSWGFSEFTLSESIYPMSKHKKYA